MAGIINIILATTGVNAVVGALGKVQGSLGGIAAVGGTATAALAGIKGALDYGGELNDLHARTGQAVRDLVVLRRAFDNSGIGAASTAQMIGLLQKGISGLNEEGGKTDEVFKRLGLSQAALREMDVTAQMTALTDAFSRIANPAERAALSMQLFGRSGGQMLQLLGDSAALATAEREVGRLGQRAQENAARFDDVGDRLSLARERLREFWLVAAEQAIPALQTMANLIDRFNPSVVAASFAGVTAVFGSLFAAGAVMKLDHLVLDWATRQGNPIGQAFASRFLAPLTGSLANVLPIGLAAAVATAVAYGIFSGWSEAQNQIRAQANAGFDEVGKVQRMAGGIRSDADVQRTLGAAMTAQDRVGGEIQKLNGEMWLSDAQKQALASYLQQYEQLTGIITLLSGKFAEQRQAENRAADAAKERLAREKEAAEFLAGDDAKKLQDTVDLAAEEKQTLAERIELSRFNLQFLQHNLTREKERLTAAGEVNGKKAAELKIQAAIAAESEKLAKLEQDHAQRTAQASQDGADDRLREIAGRRAQLEGDFGRTEAEKWGERKRLLAEEIAAQQELLAHLRVLRETTTDQAARATYDGALRTGADKLADLQGQQAGEGADPNSVVDQLTSSLTALRNEWGTVAQQIAGSMRSVVGGAVSSVASNVTGLIMRTRSLGDAWRSVATTIVTQVVQSIVELGVRWIATQIMMATMGKAIQAASTAATAPIAAAQAAIWATPATLATIATFGAAAVAAPGFIAGANAVSMGLSAVPGFSEGGYTGRTGGIVHQEEYVFSAPAVRAIGLDNLEAMHAAGRNGRGFDSSAAPVAALGGGLDGERMLDALAKKIKMTAVVVPDERAARRIDRNSAAAGDVVSIVRAHRAEIFRQGPGRA
jgi:hypothetical protein